MRKIVLLVLLISSAAFAQQPADPAVLARELIITQQSRASILNGLTNMEARASLLQEELAKAQARIADLEKQLKDASK
jgi:Skp family chaperone for outer membrane proteins